MHPDWPASRGGFAYCSREPPPGQDGTVASSAQLANPDSKRISLSPTDSYPQHAVTAVIVAHDGAGWLAHGLEALSNQTKPVQRVVAVDTGSRDRSGSVLAARLGQGAVFGMDRSAGYAAAVRRAVQHKAASAPLAAGQPGRGRPGQYDIVAACRNPRADRRTAGFTREGRVARSSSETSGSRRRSSSPLIPSG